MAEHDDPNPPPTSDEAPATESKGEAEETPLLEERIAKWAGELNAFLDEQGFNTPSLRWRLHRYREDLLAQAESKRNQRPQSERPQLCPSCGMLAGAGAPICPQCQTPMSGPSAWRGRLIRQWRENEKSAQQLSNTQILVRMILAVYLLSLFITIAGIQDLRFSPTGGVLWALGSYIPRAVWAGEIWRTITTLFLHGGLLHLAFNAYGLHVLGTMAESIYGRDRFLWIFLFSGFAGTLGTAIYNFQGSSVGASGAIFGILGCLFVYGRFYAGLGGGRTYQVVKQWIVFGLIYGLVAPGIDNGAHIGGLLGGALMGKLMGRPEIWKLKVATWGTIGSLLWLLVLAALMWGWGGLALSAFN